MLGVHSTRGASAALFSGACEGAARLAVAEHNAGPGRAYDLTVRLARDRGDAASAREAVRSFTADRDGGAFLYRISDGAARFVARADDIGRRA
ncbi:hypothetical protein ACFXAE_29020 [Streptomyces sp. NPDC059454]|uniref:hypothetical protein n=1 Tax=Streptomyces sp. NPDC059454 TaxID=3346836 RepID=UPI0036C3EC29